MRPPFLSSDTRFAARIAAFYAALFVLSGIVLPFFPVWLQAKGVDAALIGITLAAPQIMRVLAIPLVTRHADRKDALRGTLVMLSLMGLAGYVAVSMAEGGLIIFIAYALTALATTPIMPVLETYALRSLGTRGRAYGAVRLWGSVAFIVGVFATGFVADIVAPRDLIWLIVAASAVALVTAVNLRPLPPHEPGVIAAAQPKRLLRDRAFLIVAASAALTQSSHAVYYGFSSLEWRHAGLDGTAIAALWSVGVIAEIILFVVAARLPAFLTPSMMLVLGGAGGALRWAAMAFDPPVYVLPALQMLHAFSFGMTYLGALFFTSRHAPPGQAATAQGYLAIIIGLAMAAAMGVSGWLYGLFGAKAYAAMALAAVVGCAYGAVADRAARRVAGNTL
ncbi:MFS transporter [Undibacter mobilis]|uniref:MFS transporter n=1 Tax=Undibacter mobilis TaxID=2292256 RepID=A0A371BC19_9BRAD|nr:MFS transporter [Undibacter mobilis]RDV05149.1 MFS transporter [Undibacter mobilis]